MKLNKFVKYENDVRFGVICLSGRIEQYFHTLCYNYRDKENFND